MGIIWSDQSQIWRLGGGLEYVEMNIQRREVEGEIGEDQGARATSARMFGA